MKKIIIFMALTAISISSFAIPARPGWKQFTQPDGSVIEVRLVGDEFGHSLMDRSGNVLEMDSEGYLRPVPATKAIMRSRAAASKRAEAKARRIRSKVSEKVSGSPHIPVLLVEFSDQKFKDSDLLDTDYDVYEDTPQAAFSNLLNKSGYDYNGATGSVNDFYVDNSNGVYDPIFDVLPVVTLENPMATYGGNDSNGNDKAPERAVYEAVKALDASYDFSQYDHDGDGYIDMILMYYAGLNEAEYGDEDTIWPHQWSVQYSSTGTYKSYMADGKRLHKYFCTSELSSTKASGSGSNYVATKGVLCGIGTTCHEFAHSLGLPDFYDTDYGENGAAGGTYTYDTMCSGPYNNNGNTPPFFGAEELLLLGWMDSLTDLPTMCSVTIPALSKTDKVAYKGASSTDGEYFVFECRGSGSWDKYIDEGPGMLVYHVDKSSRKIYSNLTAYTLWKDWESYNSINAIGTHPCYYIIPAGCQNYNADTSSSDYGNPTKTTGLNYSGSDFTFGTSSSYSEYTPVDWESKTMDYTLKNISYSNSSVSFKVGDDICYITAPESLSAGSTFNLSLQNAPSGSSVAWYYDDTALSGTSLTLAAGKHLIEAKVTSGKKTIRLELEIEVE